MSERYLEGKKGYYIDGYKASIYFPNYVEQYGGSGFISESFPDDLVDQAKNGQLNFLIVHNYGLHDKERLLEIRKTGVEILLIQKLIVPPEHIKEFNSMHSELGKVGVQAIKTNRRANEIIRFLKRVYCDEFSE